MRLKLRVRAPYTIQNPSEVQNTPQNTPRILSRNQNTKKIRKIYENRGFRNFFVFFLYFGFGRGFGVYFGVYFGLQRGFVFCRGRRNSQDLKKASPKRFLGRAFLPRDRPGVPVTPGPPGDFLNSEILFRQEKGYPYPHFWVRISSGGVGVFHMQGWGPKSSVCPSKPGNPNLFDGISRNFARISRLSPKSLRKTKNCVQFSSPISVSGERFSLNRPPPWGWWGKESGSLRIGPHFDLITQTRTGETQVWIRPKSLRKRTFVFHFRFPIYVIVFSYV